MSTRPANPPSAPSSSPPPASPPSHALGRRRLLGWGLGVALLALLIWAVVRFVSPLPPRTLVLSTGLPDGAYQRFGERYRELLRSDGIVLELRPSSGGIENLRRLAGGQVDVGFVQGGTGLLALDGTGGHADAADGVAGAPLRSLATVAYEPAWIFSRTLDLDAGLAPLAGRRVAVGVAGSGNRKVAAELLALYGVREGPGFIDAGGLAAARMLADGEIDAAILIAAPQAPGVQQLLADPALRLASLTHAQGLARRLPYLHPVALKRGSVDPAADRPPRDIALLATTANLVAREDLHPALAYLLLEAARQVHRQPSLVNRPDAFPAMTATEFPLSTEAERYFRNGRPFLQAYLPFWMANYVQRILLLLVPLAAILVPLARLLPELVAWRRQSRLFRHYGELKFLEQSLREHRLDEGERAQARERLDRIEQEILRTRFPLDFTDRVYTLRQHVDYVRAQIDRQAAPGLTRPPAR